MKKYKRIGLLSSVAALCVISAQADLKLSENFDGYTAGSLEGQGGWSHQGAEANPFLVAADGTINRGANTGYAAIGKSVTGVNAGTVWFAVDLTLNSTTQQAGFSIGSTTFLDETSPRMAGDGAGFSINASAISATAFIGATSNRVSSASANALTVGTTYTILGKIEYADGGDDTISLWNVEKGAADDLGNYTALTASAAVDNSTFNILSLQDNKNATWDNIGLYTLGDGQTDQDALTALGTSMTIPEPATLGLLGIAGSALIFIRRKFSL